jgi:hypothetical protein
MQRGQSVYKYYVDSSHPAVRERLSYLMNPFDESI